MKQPITVSLVFISRRLRIMAGTALLIMSLKVFLLPGQPSVDTATVPSASTQIATQVETDTVRSE